MSDVQMALQQVQENEVMVFIFAAAGLLLIGFWLGYAVRRWSWEPRRKQRARFDEAPTPVAAQVPPLRRGQVVRICGADWYRMN